MNAVRQFESFRRDGAGLALTTMLLFVGWLMCWPETSSAQNAPTLQEVVKSVKKGTVHVRVKFETGTVVEGSGFFVEPGLVATNAHVLGFLGAASQKAQSYEVVVNSGEADSKTLVGQFAAAEIETDLGLLRVIGAGLPEPLRLGTTNDLVETNEVLIFGFPFGDRLGKAITVTKSTITSLRQGDGQLSEIQVNGGIHPGNSGGPVVNQSGEVIGIAVSAIAGTTIHQVIPVDKLRNLLNGRVTYIQSQLAFVEMGQLKIPLRIGSYDPLKRLKNLRVEYWLGANGKTDRRPASRTQPEPVEGDTEIQSVEVPYQFLALTPIDLPVPPLTDPKQCYWIRATGVDGTNLPFWSAAVGNMRPIPVERREASVKFQPKPGSATSLQLTSESTFQVQTGTRKEKQSMSVRVTTKPTVMTPNDEGDILVKLGFNSVGLGLKVNDQPVKVKETWAPLSQGFLKTTATLQFGDDGSVITSRSDVKKASAELQESLSAISDQVLQSFELLSVPLPDGTLRPLEKVRTQRSLLVGLPGMFVPIEVDTRYRYLGIRPGKEGQETAAFEITGTLRPRRGNQGKIGGRLTGNVDLLTATGELHRGFAAVTVDLEVADSVPFHLVGTSIISCQPALSNSLK